MSAATVDPINFFLVKILVNDEPDNVLHNTIVIVPVKFFIVDTDNNNTLYVYYLQPPYKDEDIQLLQSLTSKNDLPPPEHWTLYKAEIVNGVGYSM